MLVIPERKIIVGTVHDAVQATPFPVVVPNQPDFAPFPNLEFPSLGTLTQLTTKLIGVPFSFRVDGEPLSDKLTRILTSPHLGPDDVRETLTGAYLAGCQTGSYVTTMLQLRTGQLDIKEEISSYCLPYRLAHPDEAHTATGKHRIELAPKRIRDWSERIGLGLSPSLLVLPTLFDSDDSETVQ